MLRIWYLFLDSQRWLIRGKFSTRTTRTVTICHKNNLYGDYLSRGWFIRCQFDTRTRWQFATRMICNEDTSLQADTRKNTKIMQDFEMLDHTRNKWVYSKWQLKCMYNYLLEKTLYEVVNSVMRRRLKPIRTERNQYFIWRKKTFHPRKIRCAPRNATMWYHYYHLT